MDKISQLNIIIGRRAQFQTSEMLIPPLQSLSGNPKNVLELFLMFIAHTQK